MNLARQLILYFRAKSIFSESKLEEKNNKETTKKQVKELDSFLTSVQKVVKLIYKKDDYTTIEPKKNTSKKR